jgi:protein TonB
MRCTIAHDGRMKNCQVLSETPADFEFGAAALKLAPSFRLKAPRGALTQAGGSVTLPIVFIPQ